MWTKLLTLEMIIFALQLMVKNSLHLFYFEIERAPSEKLTFQANWPMESSLCSNRSRDIVEQGTNYRSQFSLSGRIFFQWATATLKGLIQLKEIYFKDFHIHHFWPQHKLCSVGLTYLLRDHTLLKTLANFQDFWSLPPSRWQFFTTIHRQI